MAQIVIHALQVGGGTLALTSMPGRGGDYSGDLDAVTGWKPGLILSMTTEVEMILDGARDFGADVRSRACRWVHLPVEDYGIPSDDIDMRWVDASESARHALSGGGRVLIHCKGGCGRSGMAVLRLMVECGEHPDEALKRLRALRPCAVETDAQLRWATAPASVLVAE